MVPCSRRLFARALNQDRWDPIELLIITLPAQNPASAIRLTNAQQAVTWRGYLYTSFGMSRSEIDDKVASNAGEVNLVTMTLQNVDRQMAEMVGSCDADGATAELWLTSRDKNADGDGQPLLGNNDPMLITKGEIRNIALSAEQLTFEIRNVLGLQEEITVPRRVFQSKCNYRFGSTPCGVDLMGNDASGVPITFPAVAGAGSTANLLVLDPASFPGANDEMFENAIAIFSDGRDGLQPRPIERSESLTRFYMRQPFLRHPTPGDALYVRRSCRKVRTGVESCTTFRGDADAFGGFPEVPPVRFKPAEVRVD